MRTDFLALLRRSAATVLLGLLAACGGGGDAPDDAEATSRDVAENQTLRVPKGLRGTLIFTRNEPLKATKVMRLNFKLGRYEVAADGWDPSIGENSMAFLQKCSPLAVRLAVTDSDGFSGPASECFELDTITPDFFRPKMSRDDELIAVANTAILLPKDELPDTAAAQFGIGDNTYVATQIYRPSGELVAELRGFTLGEWTRRGELVVVGGGGDTGYGLYRADKKFKSTERIDDGRIRGEIVSLDTHPKKDRVVFVYNGQIFEMDLNSGSPKRIHSHGYPLSAVTYSPSGDAIAFVSSDPLQEAMETPGSGYHLYVLRDGEVDTIVLPFIPGGPLDWVD
ncbi:MAG: hypothetical protein AAFN07_07955 [Pseudomonadota bacterium]